MYSAVSAVRIIICKHVQKTFVIAISWQLVTLCALAHIVSLSPRNAVSNIVIALYLCKRWLLQWKGQTDWKKETVCTIFCCYMPDRHSSSDVVHTCRFYACFSCPAAAVISHVKCVCWMYFYFISNYEYSFM
jgi:hypothetical protein